MHGWLKHILDISMNDNVGGKLQLDEVPVTFAGFFSRNQGHKDVKPRVVIRVLPVFNKEKADTLSMQKNVMCITKRAIDFVNPRQTPTIEGDCPLYTCQKKKLLLFRASLCEQSMVCMIVFLHLCAQEAQ